MPTVPGIEADDANSNDIKQEISRFESVHPAIYAMYDLIESLADRRQAEMFRRQVASVEDAFVNSQEWTLGHTVPQIKLGLLGSVNSGKSALVHRYLTGTYLKDESPEGGRFKKEVVLDGQSYLLLIRDEGGPPDEQFSRWIDGAVFVFSLDSEESFRVVCDYYERLDTFRETHDLPIILVGTQDSTSDSNPRVIDDAKARRLANSLNKCPYFETCSTYGLNVERVFQDACYKIVQSRPDLSYLLSANVAPHLQRAQQFQMFQQQQQRSQPVYPIQPAYPMQPHVPAASYRDRMMPSMSQVHSATMSGVDANLANCMNAQMSMQCMHANTTARGGSYQHRLPPLPVDNGTNGTTMGSQPSGDTRHSDMHNNPGFEPDFGDPSKGGKKKRKKYKKYLCVPKREPRLGGTDGEAKDSLTPNSTPTQSRKTRPKSNLFRKTDDNREKEKKVIDGIGSGRSIPIKQGYLYKRTCKPLNKEWKTKKYVALTDDARLIYHPSIQDYVQNAHGKEIDLSRVTVKIPGVNFRQTGGQQVNSCSSTAVSAAAASNSSSNNNGGGGARSQGDVSGSDKLSTSLENTAGGGGGGGVLDGTQSPSEGIINTGNRLMSQQGSKETSKKRYRRVKSTQKTGATDGYESEGYEFQLISMDRAWNFEAHSAEERDEWVSHIDRAIITRLQLLESSNSSNSRQQQQQQQQGGHSLHPHFHPHHHQQNQSGHHQEASGNSGSGGGGGWGGGHGTTGSDPGAAAAGGGGRGGGGGGSGGVDEAMAKSLRAVAGNDACADCGAPDPDWASLNLGELVCIECSGVHRRLGTHISRVRSLLLDDWTPEAAAVMRAIGNTLANSVWEAAVPANLNSRRKPDSRSSKEEMEAWIRAKYEQREFLPPLPYPEAPLQQQLIDAIARQDTRQVVLCLARATPETVNAPYSRQDSRAAIHIAATLGNIVYLQLLLWYNGDPKVVDSEGRNAFYYAHCSCHFDCANFLARNGCPRQTVPAPALAHFAAASQQQQQQQALPPTTKSQQQQQVGMTPKHHSAMAYQQQQQQPQPPTPQQQQQQMVMGYRGGPGVPQPQQQLPPPTPQAAAGGFAPVFMHNIMPGSAGNHPMHGTMGGGGGGLASGATVAAGATLPRRRGPFGPPAATAGGAGGMYLPSQPIPTSSTTVANSMANRPLPVAGAFDPSTMAGATNQAQNAKPGDPPEISI